MARSPRDVNNLTSNSSVDELFDVFRAGFRARKFSAGLLIAFIDMFKHLGTPNLELGGWQDFEGRFPPLETNRRGAANTLTVDFEGGQLTLRRFYDPVETFFRAEHHRMDYPNCAPHATQAWGEARYRTWLDILVKAPEGELNRLRNRVVDFILRELPDHSTFDAAESVKPPVFTICLSSFDMSAQRGERSGAPFQGLVFGFLRADNPHLQVTASKVRSGGARHGAVGDVDCWDGTRLALTAEVKHFVLTDDDVVREITDFAERVRQKGALGLVVALGFEEAAAARVKGLGLTPVSHETMIDHASLWESKKQEMAVDYTMFSYLRLEMSAVLTDRFRDFVSNIYQEDNSDPSEIE